MSSMRVYLRSSRCAHIFNDDGNMSGMASLLPRSSTDDPFYDEVQIDVLSPPFSSLVGCALARTSRAASSLDQQAAFLVGLVVGEGGDFLREHSGCAGEIFPQVYQLPAHAFSSNAAK